MTENKFNISWIQCLMQELAESHPLFHSESYFQHELAGLLHRKGYKIKKEETFKYGKDGKDKMRLDIWLHKEKVAIEVKYRTSKLDKELLVNRRCELFQLRNQSAANIARYNYLKDVKKLETFRKECCPEAIGYAILLTNYKLLQKCTKNKDADFSLHDGREIKGPLKWKGDPNTGTPKGRPEFSLAGPYNVEWQYYPERSGCKNGLFKYLAFRVPPPE